MPSPADLAWQELDAFAQRMEPRVRRAFLEAVTRLRQDLTDAELEELVRTGDVRPLLDRLELQPFKLAVRDAVVNAADNSATGLPFTVRLDTMNPLVARVVQASELALVSGLQTEVADGVRQTLLAGIRAGVNPVDTARQLRTVIGLTAKQVQSVANYRALLTGGKTAGQPLREALSRGTRDGRFDRSILSAITTRTPLQPAQVETQVARFEQRLLQQRAETVARTETITALWRGQHLQWQQAIDEGKVTEPALRRYWHVAKDERVCAYCKPIPELNPDGVAFSQPFLTPGGTLMGPAAHPNCRCVVFVKIDFAQLP